MSFERTVRNGIYVIPDSAINCRHLTKFVIHPVSLFGVNFDPLAQSLGSRRNEF